MLKSISGMVVIASLSVCLNVGDGQAQSRMREAQPDRSQTERPRDPAPAPRPDLPHTEAQTDVQAMSDGRLDVLWNRVMVMGCSGTSTRNISMRLACPDGSTIDVDMRCTSTSSGAWPNCHTEESCTQTNTESCPPAEKEPED